MTELINRTSQGLYVIAATPFTDDGALDLDSTDRMVDFYLEKGVSGMTILGIMGEAPKLSSDESKAFVARVMKRIDGKVPVIVGVSAPGMDPMKALTQDAMAAGAAGVMVAPLTGMGPEDKVKGYFHAVAKALGPDVPICLQDYPQTSGVRFSVDTLVELFAEIPQIVMLKHEDWPGLTKLTQVRARTGTGDVPRVSILTGNSALFLPQEMQRGADGAMTGFAYPEMMVEVVAAALKGDHDRAEDVFDAYLPLVRYEQQLGLGLALRKEVLRRRGAIASAKVRAPGPSVSKEDAADLDRLTARLEHRLKELG